MIIDELSETRGLASTVAGAVDDTCCRGHDASWRRCDQRQEEEKLTQLEEKQDQDTGTNGAWELCAILRRLTREVGATDLRLHRVSAGIREHNHA